MYVQIRFCDGECIVIEFSANTRSIARNAHGVVAAARPKRKQNVPVLKCIFENNRVFRESFLTVFIRRVVGSADGSS